MKHLGPLFKRQVSQTINSMSTRDLIKMMRLQILQSFSLNLVISSMPFKPTLISRQAVSCLRLESFVNIQFHDAMDDVNLSLLFYDSQKFLKCL